MPVKYCLGKRPARHDPRVPLMTVAAPALQAPPPTADWYNKVTNWGMLANDTLGDCVEAAVLHSIEQFSTYAGAPVIPSSQEAVTFYADATGYTPSNPATDQGSYVLGSGGVMQYWLTKGVVCGGKSNKVKVFLQIARRNPYEWMQGIFTFGGMLTGIQLPQVIMSGNSVPSVWADYFGPIDGGHEIWINGYEMTSTGRVYDLVSWGQMYKATEEFLLHVVDETVVVVDPVEINARGVDAGGLTMDQLAADIAALHTED